MKIIGMNLNILAPKLLAILFFPYWIQMNWVKNNGCNKACDTSRQI